MKLKNKKIMTVTITSLVLLSSISVITPVITHYINSGEKNSIMLKAANSYSTRKLSSDKYSESTNRLISNLTYINKYINSTLIVKEKLLRLSILGGTYDKTTKYKNDKKKKISELAKISHDLKHVHRYGDQARATINNSLDSLDKESGIISQIISIIKDHPYTFNSYLNKLKISIPNINYFTDTNNLGITNNLNHMRSDISNNSYGINVNSTNMNSIALFSEEDGVNAKRMYVVGSSVFAAAFEKITFKAKIIIFDKKTNSFKDETPTAVKKTTNKTSSSTQLDTKSSEISNANSIKTNNFNYLNSSRLILSSLNSSNNVKFDNLPTPLVPNYLPGYFNKQLFNEAEARVKYNHISSFKNNKSFYYSLIFSPFLVVATVLGIYGSYKILKRIEKNKLQKILRIDFEDRLNRLQAKIKPSTQELSSDKEFVAYLKETHYIFVKIRRDVGLNPINERDSKIIIRRIEGLEEIYDNNTYLRRQKLFPIDIRIDYLTDDTPLINPDEKAVALGLVQTKNANEIKNIIEQYANARGEFSKILDNFASQDELNEYVRHSIEPFYNSINDLLSEPQHVKAYLKWPLMTQLRKVMTEMHEKANARIIILKRIQAETEETMRLAEQDDTAIKEQNREDSQKIVTNIKTEINALEKINDKETLLIEAEKISIKQGAITEKVNKQEYNSVEDADHLVAQTLSLKIMLSDKVRIIERRILELNKTDAQNVIINHNIKINELGKIDNDADLRTAAAKLTDSVPEIVKFVTDRNYTDDTTACELKKQAESLIEMIDSKIRTTKIKIQNVDLSRNTVERINNNITALENKLTNETPNLQNIEDTQNFITEIEGQLTNIVQDAKDNKKIISACNLKQFHDRVTKLRADYKQMYEEKRAEFKLVNDNIKQSITTDLEIENDKLFQCKYIKDNGNVSGKPDKLTPIEIQESNNKIPGLRSDIHALTLQLQEKNAAEVQADAFKLPEGLLNILEV